MFPYCQCETELINHKLIVGSMTNAIYAIYVKRNVHKICHISMTNNTYNFYLMFHTLHCTGYSKTGLTMQSL